MKPRISAAGTYYARHREERRAYEAAHRAEITAYRRAYSEVHREDRAAYRTAHTEETAAYQRVWRLDHREEIAAYNAAWSSAHPDYRHAYDLSHPDQSSRKYANRSGAAICDHPSCLALGPVALAWQTNEHVCYICDAPLWRGVNLHMDHVIPISKGGVHCAGNLRPSCATCNCRKGARVAE